METTIFNRQVGVESKMRSMRLQSRLRVLQEDSARTQVFNALNKLCAERDELANSGEIRGIVELGQEPGFGMEVINPQKFLPSRLKSETFILTSSHYSRI